jgi:hypothetical protein
MPIHLTVDLALHDTRTGRSVHCPVYRVPFSRVSRATGAQLAVYSDTNGALMDTVFNKVKATPDETLLQVLRAPQPEKLSPRLRRTCAPSLQRPLTINDQDLSHGKAYAAIAIAVTLAIVVQSGPVGSQPAEGDINPVIAFRSTMIDYFATFGLVPVLATRDFAI